MSDLWTTAATDHLAEARAGLLARARVAVSRSWPFLAAAKDQREFDLRKAIATADIDSEIAQITGGFGAEFDVVKPQIEASLDADFEILRTQREAAALTAALQAEADYKYVKKEGDEWVITQKGTGKVLSRHPSQEEAESAFRAMESHMHGSKTAGDRVSDEDYAALDAAWHRSFDALRAAGLEADADHPIAAAYRDASKAVNHANRSRDFSIATGGSKTAGAPVLDPTQDPTQQPPVDPTAPVAPPVAGPATTIGDPSVPVQNPDYVAYAAMCEAQGVPPLDQDAWVAAGSPTGPDAAPAESSGVTEPPAGVVDPAPEVQAEITPSDGVDETIAALSSSITEALAGLGDGEDDDDLGEGDAVPFGEAATAALHTEAALRPIHEIAGDIHQLWRKQPGGVHYTAKPYLDAMHSLGTVDDHYGADDGRGVLAYFLSNARSFRGPEAAALKAELKAHLNTRRSSSLDARFAEIAPGIPDDDAHLVTDQSATGRRIDVLHRIVDNHQHEEVDGHLVDPTTANMLIQVHDALKDENKARFDQVPLQKLVDLGWKHTMSSLVEASTDLFSDLEPATASKTAEDRTQFGAWGDHCPHCGHDWKEPHDPECLRMTDPEAARRLEDEAYNTSIDRSGSLNQVQASTRPITHIACRKCAAAGYALDGAPCDYCDGQGRLDLTTAVIKEADGFSQGLTAQAFKREAWMPFPMVRQVVPQLHGHHVNLTYNDDYGVNTISGPMTLTGEHAVITSPSNRQTAVPLAEILDIRPSAQDAEKQPIDPGTPMPGQPRGPSFLDYARNVGPGTFGSVQAAAPAYDPGFRQDLLPGQNPYLESVQDASAPSTPDLPPVPQAPQSPPAAAAEAPMINPTTDQPTTTRPRAIPGAGESPVNVTQGFSSLRTAQEADLDPPKERPNSVREIFDEKVTQIAEDVMAQNPEMAPAQAMKVAVAVVANYPETLTATVGS